MLSPFFFWASRMGNWREGLEFPWRHLENPLQRWDRPSTTWKCTQIWASSPCPLAPAFPVFPIQLMSYSYAQELKWCIYNTICLFHPPSLRGKTRAEFPDVESGKPLPFAMVSDDLPLIPRIGVDFPSKRLNTRPPFGQITSLKRSLGYTGEARFVSFYWIPGGDEAYDEAYYDDGGNLAGSAFLDGYAPACMPSLTSLKAHPIIRISKHYPVDGKRETKRRVVLVEYTLYNGKEEKRWCLFLNNWHYSRFIPGDPAHQSLASFDQVSEPAVTGIDILKCVHFPFHYHEREVRSNCFLSLEGETIESRYGKYWLVLYRMVVSFWSCGTHFKFTCCSPLLWRRQILHHNFSNYFPRKRRRYFLWESQNCWLQRSCLAPW